ncbi:MAG: replicative DNA helicase [Planctomycetes bacterium]|nr:replicative DNA helicase [Planctomycetota bacterium]
MATADRSEGRNGAKRSVTEFFDRQPPQNLDAERAVLGSILLDPQCCDDIALRVRGDDFFAPEHRTLFNHLLGMHNDGVRIDSTLLVERLRKHGEFESVGGINFLLEIADAVPTATNAGHYAEIVRDKATLRSMIGAAGEILRDSYDHSLEARELLARAEEKIFAILEKKGTGSILALKDVLDEAMARIDARMQQGGGLSGLPTGFTDIDALTGGMHGSELIILAARPSMGKTAFAANIAEHCAAKEERTVLFVSLEMSRLELAERILCSHGRINGHKLRNNMLSAMDRRKFVETSNKLSQAPLFIDDTPSRTITEIAAAARRLKLRNELALVVIDYLQLIEPDNAKDPRQEQVAKIARRLKGMARELRVPVICLAQLNRQTEMSRENIPRLSHLRESGAIEQDADVVMFVHREEYYATSQEEKERLAGQADIIIAKQRNGPIGDVKVAWAKDYTRFENLARTDEYGFN